MNILVAIDDTDSPDEGATGHLAEEISVEMANRGVGKASRITRHQLFIHSSIPYTSHNSSMAFSVTASSLESVYEIASHMLEERSISGSDPGLCLVDVGSMNDRQRRELMEFGRDAKRRVLSKEEAYSTAARIGVRLSEHGGTGGGVIGALAGAGLRLSGNDGRFRGWLDGSCGEVSVAGLVAMQDIDEVRAYRTHEVLGSEDKVEIRGRMKTVLLGGRVVLLVYRENGVWKNCLKEQLKDY
jgi:hypothetical protein